VRRIVGAILCFALLAIGVAFSTQAGAADTFRVAAVFDTAKGMVPGQQVKIAGALVGEVEAVDVVPGPKARITLSVPRRFSPFHDDASCQLLPQGIISENYVACDPGALDRPDLAAVDGVQTVPLAQTSVPTSLQDVLDVFAAPTADRIRLLISELGLATAGTGEDLNALLRRANPALVQSARLLETVNEQRASLDEAIVQTDRVVAALADRREDLDAFVGRAAEVTSETASRAAALSESVRRLPPMLAAARPALDSLDRAMIDSTPLLGALQDAAPALSETTRRFPPFARAAADALTLLSPVADTGRRTVAAATPLAASLQTAAAKAVPFAQDTDALLRDTRDRGGVEGIMRWFYGLATATAAYDSTSHFVTGLLRVLPQCVASASSPGCTTKYNSAGQGTIPPDSPGCGPQSGAPWDPPTDCISQVPTRRRGSARPSRPAPRPVATPVAPVDARPTTQPESSTPRVPAEPEPTPPIIPKLPKVPLPDLPSALDVKPLLDFLLRP
jgi:virulence factor Mce-like protein